MADITIPKDTVTHQIIGVRPNMDAALQFLVQVMDKHKITHPSVEINPVIIYGSNMEGPFQHEDADQDVDEICPSPTCPCGGATMLHVSVAWKGENTGPQDEPVL